MAALCFLPVASAGDSAGETFCESLLVLFICLLGVYLFALFCFTVLLLPYSFVYIAYIVATHIFWIHCDVGFGDHS